MSLFKPYLGKPVAIDVTDYRGMTGVLIDIGEDYLVMHRDSSYYYIALHHLHLLTADLDTQTTTSSIPQWTASGSDFNSLLQTALGEFVALYITGQQTLYGQILHIKDDYIVLDTVRHHISYIPTFHIKWFSPAAAEGFLDKDASLLADPHLLKQTWQEQLKNCAGTIVVLDLGLRTNQVGRVQAVEGGIIELITPDGLSKCWNSAHIKSIHKPGRT